MAQSQYLTSQGQIMLHKPLLPKPGKYKQLDEILILTMKPHWVKNQQFKCHHQNRINWLRVARPYRRMWRWEPSSLNNYPDIKLFAIQKNRSEWLRKLTNRQRNTSCNQNLGRRRSKKEKKKKEKSKFERNQEFVRHINFEFWNGVPCYEQFERFHQRNQGQEKKFWRWKLWAF